MSIEEELKERADRVSETIEAFLPDEEGQLRTITEAMRYACLSGGKRIRPILMGETCLLFGEIPKILPYFGSAIEFIHAASLVHDDLPCMDDDDLRRGMPTTHKKFGENFGVLAGDALLNYAYEVAATAVENEAVEAIAATNDASFNATDARMDALRAAKAMGILTRNAGVYGMIGGQCADVEGEGKKLSEKELVFIHENKTTAMIESAMMIGAVLGGADDDSIKLIGQAAKELGMAFQIRDDILDVTGDEETIGKPVGSDEKNHKYTYVTLKGVEECRKEVTERTQRAITIIDSLGGSDSFLRRMMLWLVDREM